MKKNDIERLSRYLGETLGIPAIPEPLMDSFHLPFFLRNSYSFFEIKILDCICILAVDLNTEEQSPAIVRKNIDQIRVKYDKEIIYVRKQITAYNRKRLIEHKVPFIVPGNQMYLPMLGIDMREYFKKMRSQPGKLNPSAQALGIYLCLKNTDEIITPAKIARQLGYSAMTLTRAFDELEANGIGEFFDQGRERCMRLTENKKTMWEKILPLLRSPVKKRFYIRTKDQKQPGPLSGLSALAHYSMLAEPNNPVFAFSSVDWKKYLQEHHKESEIVLQEPDTFEIEIWSYDPLLFSKDGIVDRLSLYVSLKDDHDERIESELERMLKEIQW